jgi:hypothetical protein
MHRAEARAVPEVSDDHATIREIGIDRAELSNLPTRGEFANKVERRVPAIGDPDYPERDPSDEDDERYSN